MLLAWYCIVFLSTENICEYKLSKTWYHNSHGCKFLFVISWITNYKEYLHIYIPEFFGCLATHVTCIPLNIFQSTYHFNYICRLRFELIYKGKTKYIFLVRVWNFMPVLCRQCYFRHTCWAILFCFSLCDYNIMA